MDNFLFTPEDLEAMQIDEDMLYINSTDCLDFGNIDAHIAQYGPLFNEIIPIISPPTSFDPKHPL